MTLWPKGGILHLWLTQTTSLMESGATDLLATSSTANWLIWACTPHINQETLEEAHGTPNLEISLFLDYLHYSEDRRHTQDDWAVLHPWVIHYDSYLVLVVPLDTGYFNIHHNKSFSIHHDTAYAPYWRNFSSHFLSEAVQRHDIHFPLMSIGRGDEIELRPIV